jgi:hypothetical protein
MSSITAVRLTRISPERLSNLLLTVPTEEKVAVIDVRDSDHIGGHIKVPPLFYLVCQALKF